MSLLIAYGTRPEYIKLKPIINGFNNNNIEYKTIFTGQHTTLIGDHKPDYIIEIKDGKHYLDNRLDSIIASCMNGITKPNSWWDITHLIVQGDTTSVLGLALSAFHRGIKVIHLEAGLRTYDKENPYPEEINRRIVSQIADIHLCPTDNGLINLVNEKVQGGKYVVGNTVLDNLLPYKKDCEYTNKILITLHRRENHHWIDKWFIELDKLAKEYNELEFILPIHPNPNVQKHKNLLKCVNIIDPLPYDELLKLLIKTKLVITDSGGLQEESSFFNKKCLTCRKFTERPEAIGQSTFMVESPDKLYDIFNEHVNDYKIDYISPFGDGYAAEKIVKILKNIGI